MRLSLGQIRNREGRGFWNRWRAALVIVFTWTCPTNVARENSTVSRESWRELRSQREYSYAVNGLVTRVAFCCVAAATLLPGWRAADVAAGRWRHRVANGL